MKDSYYFHNEHQLFRKSLKDFLQKEVLLNVDSWEEIGRLPKSIFKKFGDMGFFGLGMDEKYGGVNTDLFYLVILIEELNKCKSGGTAASLLAHSTLAMEHINKNASDQLKDKYLTKAIAGESVGCLAITEPHSGSDVASLKTKADKKGDFYIVNGAKTFITNGVYSDFIVAAVRTGKEGYDGISMLLIDHNSKGVEARPLKKLGWHASDTAELSFDNVKVPASNLIGKENMGFLYIMQRFELERLVLSIGSIAAAEDALEYALNYIAERKAFGRTINKFQVIRHHIAQLSAEIECQKAFNYQICKAFENGQQVKKECAMSKLLSSELMDKVSYRVLQFLGGYGYMEEYKAARIFRDSRLGTIGGGTSEIMREIISASTIN